MRINPHLTFNGQCKAAFEMYAKCLGGKIVTMATYGGSPMAEQAPAEWQNLIAHATLDLGEFRITGGDAPPGQYQKPQGFSILLELGTASEAERVFGELAQAGAVQLPLQETFWAERFGMLADQYGVPWMINCSKAASGAA